MTALLLILIAGILAWTCGGHAMVRAGAAVLAIVGGLTLPDVDQWLPLLDHRDGLTHSMLPAVLLAVWQRLRAVAGGAALGLALHLSADCFPDAMRGYATVKLPLAGSLGDWSYLWLGGHALAGASGFALLSTRLEARGVQLALTSAAVAIGLVYLATVKGGWWVLLVLAGLAWLSARPSWGSGPRRSATTGPAPPR